MQPGVLVPPLEAVKLTILLLNEYKCEKTLEDALKLDFKFCSPEEFLQASFEKYNHPEDIKEHATELFFKISKHRKYLETILNGFTKAKDFKSEDKTNQFSIGLVFLYLILIELNEATKKPIEDLLMTINLKNALALVIFLQKPSTQTELYERGAEIWDIEYVNSILENILKTPLLGEVCESLKNEWQKFKKPQTKAVKLTVPIGPKCLNQQKPKVVTPEETTLSSSSQPRITRIPIMIKATQVPSSTYTRPIQLEKIEKARVKHHERARKLYEEAQEKAFNCARAEKSEKFKELEEKIQKERFNATVKKTQPKKIKTTNAIQPKKTAAVILREGARLLKLEEEEIKKYEDLAQGGFNCDLLAEWEEEIREEEFQKQLEEIEKKHLEGLLSYEEALLAKKEYIRKKQESAIEFRKEKQTWVNQLEEWRKEEQMRIRLSVEKGKAYEKGAKEAVENAKEEKHKLALETMEESRALKERWLREKEEDLKKKVQLIKEIKALQAIGIIKRKETDFTETANLGLLYEMSLAELKERLFLMKIELKAELEKRRAEIRMRKKCRKEIVDSYQDLIDSYQKTMEEQKQQKKKSGSKCEEKENKKIKSRSFSSLDALRYKLYERRKERIFGMTSYPLTLPTKPKKPSNQMTMGEMSPKMRKNIKKWCQRIRITDGHPPGLSPVPHR